jgi:hypothetical protein
MVFAHSHSDLTHTHFNSTTPLLNALEIALNGAIIVEIAVRMCALQSHFLDSWGNLLDLCTVMLCALTLLIVNDRCTGALDLELSLDALVLVFRNVLQAIRLWRVINRYS